MKSTNRQAFSFILSRWMSASCRVPSSKGAAGSVWVVFPSCDITEST